MTKWDVGDRFGILLLLNFITDKIPHRNRSVQIGPRIRYFLVSIGSKVLKMKLFCLCKNRSKNRKIFRFRFERFCSVSSLGSTRVKMSQGQFSDEYVYEFVVFGYLPVSSLRVVSSWHIIPHLLSGSFTIINKNHFTGKIHLTSLW